MSRRLLPLALASILCAASPAAAGQPRSQAIGVPHAGKLAHGVQLPPEGRHFFTWDPVLRRSPNRGWRRFGTDRLVRTLREVLRDFAIAHPSAPRVGIGDLSRPQGGDFGVRFGYPGHVSHQNGLDVDVYYPRRDRRERAPASARQMDLRLAQDLVDRFVRAGARKIFVGPNTGLRGPPRVVQSLSYHDNHLHVRLPAVGRRSYLLGRSALGRPIRAWEVEGRTGERRVLVVGCIHGDECAGMAVTRRLLRTARVPGADLWVIPNLNPDGRALGTRLNGRGVDLNRNFPSEWTPIGRPWDPQHSGSKPLSERETRIAHRLILRLQPALTVWFHQPQGLVRAWGGSVPAARSYARLAGSPFRTIRWPAGTAPNWQNHRFPGTSSFVVELPPGALSPTDATRHANALLRLAK